jgi:hypothetical protein
MSSIWKQLKRNNMATLSDLEGALLKETPALYLFKPDDIEVIILNGYAATTAGSNGAINIWQDDEGQYRCEAMRHLATVEKKRYKKIQQAIGWTNRWMQKIK